MPERFKLNEAGEDVEAYKAKIEAWKERHEKRWGERP